MTDKHERDHKGICYPTCIACEVERLRNRLRDVVIESTTFGMCGNHDQSVIEAAGYVRCERCVDGVRTVLQRTGDPEFPVQGYPDQCDCINGWRPRDE